MPVAQLNARTVDLARYAERLNPEGILYNCTAFGEGIEQAARTPELPVLKPNEAMFDEAFNYGDNLAMIYTFPPSVGGMEKEFYEAAELRGSKAKLHSVFAQGAMDALKDSDASSHNNIVASVAKGIDNFDAILLAQFSTAQAAPVVRNTIDTPVLTGPESAINKMKSSIIT